LPGPAEPTCSRLGGIGERMSSPETERSSGWSLDVVPKLRWTARKALGDARKTSAQRPVTTGKGIKERPILQVCEVSGLHQAWQEPSVNRGIPVGSPLAQGPGVTFRTFLPHIADVPESRDVQALVVPTCRKSRRMGQPKVGRSNRSGQAPPRQSRYGL